MPMTAEDILKLADPWTAPISDGAPAGTSAKEDERYVAVTTEIARLDSPSTTEINWKNVWSTAINSGGELLTEKSKDFLIATQVAYAMYRQDGPKGLLKGVALLTGLIENFWPTMFPELKRIKGRANALLWFVEKTVLTLSQYAPQPGDRETLDNLVVASKRLSTSAREKFADACPAISPLRETVERLLMDAGPSQADVDAQAAKEQAERDAQAQRAAQEAAQRAAQEAAQRAQQAQQAQQAPPGPPMINTAPPPIAVAAPPAGNAAPPPADVSQVAAWLGTVGATLSQTANTVRTSANSAALAYRMTRIGLYMHLVDPPPADASGKTKVPPPNPNTRKQIETIASNQKWAALLEETESALGPSRFWLDLHRYSALALDGLGDSHAKARDEVLREVATVIKRFPTLPGLQFADGTPFADDATRRWIDAEVLAGGGGAPMSAPSGGGGAGPVIVVQQGGGGADEESAVVNEAKKMAAGGKGGEAIAMLHAKASGAPSLASRFRYRLGIGQVALAAGQVALAKGVFEGLELDVKAYNLEAWEPSLASASAEGLVQCYRALARGGKPIPPEAGVLYDRVCRLDPASALKLGA